MCVIRSQVIGSGLAVVDSGVCSPEFVGHGVFRELEFAACVDLTNMISF